MRSLAESILLGLIFISQLLLMLNIFVMLPLCFLKKMLHKMLLGFQISQYIYGTTVWFIGLVLTWSIWGTWAVIIGVILGVGCVPMGLVAAAINGEWDGFISLISWIIIMLVVRWGSLYFLSKTYETG